MGQAYRCSIRRNKAMRHAEGGSMKRELTTVSAPNVVRKRTQWLTMLVAAALGALIWMGVMKRDEDRRPSRPTPRARAELLRDDAIKECAQGRAPECAALLDAARRLDRTGEGEARVIEARQHLNAAP
jgi:hypothetical protein